MKKQIRNTFIDGESPASLRANKSALLEMQLEKRVVESLQKVMGIEHRRVGLLGKLGIAHSARGVDEGLPFDLGEHVLEEVGIEVDLLLDDFLDLDSEREAIDDALDVGGEHVVRQ